FFGPTKNGQAAEAANLPLWRDAPWQRFPRRSLKNAQAFSGKAICCVSVWYGHQSMLNRQQDA
ncbi:hypothetical protein, partial [Mesorhizobium sp.]|uniref:hypothetical protein n=1 Tax=Mesorhizobium sp. TaxID=1871066 RepID=UPI0025F645E6